MVRMFVKVTPNARKDEVTETQEGLSVKVTAHPEKGKANRAVLKLLTKHYGKRARLVAGEKSREKIVEIAE